MKIVVRNPHGLEQLLRDLQIVLEFALPLHGVTRLTDGLLPPCFERRPEFAQASGGLQTTEPALEVRNAVEQSLNVAHSGETTGHVAKSPVEIAIRMRAQLLIEW